MFFRMSGAVALMMLAGAAGAQSLDVPVREMQGDGEAATCGVSEVVGLKADGDGFLAVRSGPGSDYRKIGELKNGDRVEVYDRRGDWVGLVMPNGRIDQTDACAHNGPARDLTGTGIGWAHGRWLNYLYP